MTEQLVKTTSEDDIDHALAALEGALSFARTLTRRH